MECIDLLILIIIAINFYNIEGSFMWFFGALLVPQIMCVAGKFWRIKFFWLAQFLKKFCGSDDQNIMCFALIFSTLIFATQKNEASCYY